MIMNQKWTLLVVVLISTVIGCKSAPKTDSSGATTPTQQAVAAVESTAAPTLSSLTEEWNTLVKQYVVDGWVGYTDLKADPRFKALLKNQNKFDPETLKTRNEKIAFWINAYNICTIQLILKHYPVKHWDEIVETDAQGEAVKPWSVEFCKVGGEKYALDYIEGGILLGELGKSEVHFAVNCAAKSCPILRSEAYMADKLDDQLAEQYIAFMFDREKNYFDPKKKKMFLSMIYQWYKPDFEKNGGTLLGYLHDALPEEAQKLAKKKKLKVEYLEYFWDINDQKNRAALQ